MAGTRSLGVLTLDLIAKVGGFTQGMDAAARSADKRSREIAASQKRMKQQIEKEWSDIGKVIAGGVAGITIAGTFSKFIQESRDAQNEQAQLSAVLKSTGEAAGYSQEKLNAMAESLANSTVFSAGEINRAQTRLLSYTNVVGEQFPQALEALLNMAQRTGVGVEQAAETIGKALNIPSEGMASLSKQGFQFSEDQKKLAERLQASGKTAQAQKIVLDELKSSYGGAAEAARGTFGGAITALRNQLNSLMTGSEGSLQGTTDAVNDLTRTLGSDETKRAFATLTELLANVIRVLADATTHFINFGRFAGEAIGRAVAGPDDPIERLDERISGLTKDIQALDAEIARPRKFNSGGGYDSLDELKNRAKKARAELDAAQKSRAGLLQMALNGKPTTAPTPNLPKPPTIRTPGSDKAAAEALKIQLNAELKVWERFLSDQQDLLQTRNKFLDLFNSQGLLSIKDYYTQQQNILDEATGAQARAYDAQIKALKDYIAKAPKDTEKASAQEKLNDLLDKQAKLHRDAGAAAIEAGLKQAQAMKEYANTIAETNARLLDLQGEVGKAASIRFDIQNEGLMKLFSAEGSSEMLDKLKRIRELTVAQADLNKLSADYGLVQGQLQIAEDRIALAQKMGTQGELDGLVKLGEARRASYDQLKAIVEQYEKIAKASGDPQMILKADQLRLSLEQLSAELDPLANKFNTMFADSASNAFADFISGTKSAKDAFRGFIDDVFSQITKLVSQNLFQKLFGGLLGGDSGGGFNFGSWLSGLFGGGRASGGPVQPNRLYRVNEQGPELFKAANGEQFLMTGTQGGNVVPNGALRGGGQTVNVSIQGYVKRDTPDQIAMEVRRRSNIASARFGR